MFLFEYPLDLHYSQTLKRGGFALSEFEYPLDLHYSQTSLGVAKSTIRLNTLWIYTTLKLTMMCLLTVLSLNTLWIYTTLKQCVFSVYALKSLNTLWIYTTLKPKQDLSEIYAV